MTAIVYAICSRTSGKIYVGKTVSMQRRLRGHLAAAAHGDDRHLYRSIRKYGWNDFVVVILSHTITEKLAFELEKMWIAYLDLQNPENGYNNTVGGEGATDLTGQIGAKISKALTGRKFTGDRLAKAQICAKKMADLARGMKKTGKQLEQVLAAQKKAASSRLGKPNPNQAKAAAAVRGKPNYGVSQALRGKPNPGQANRMREKWQNPAYRERTILYARNGSNLAGQLRHNKKLKAVRWEGT